MAGVSREQDPRLGGADPKKPRIERERELRCIAVTAAGWEWLKGYSQKCAIGHNGVAPSSDLLMIDAILDYEYGKR